MRYLADANVLSEPTKPNPNPRVVEWLTANRRGLVVDPMILGELHVGVLALSRGRKRTQLERWFESVASTVECVPWDASTSRSWALLVTDLNRRGKAMPILDSMIAASAIHNGFTLATHNTRDFKAARVAVVDPFVAP